MNDLCYPRYQRIEFGTLVFYLRTDDVDPMRVTETLGIAYAADGTMHKHGEAERVRPSFTQLRQAFEATGIDADELRMV